jgi:protein required for attachment to host cells
VVVADASRARVLVLEPDRETGDAAASELVEVAEITNPLVRARSAAVPSHDRRDIDRHFAAEIAEEAAAVWSCYPPCELILAAGPAMLALLRPAIQARTGGPIDATGSFAPRPAGRAGTVPTRQRLASRVDPSGIHELVRDLVKLSGPRLRDELAGAGLVPPRGAAAHRSGLAGWR